MSRPVGTTCTIISTGMGTLYCREQDTRYGNLLLDGCRMSALRRNSPYNMYITWRHRTLGRMEGASTDALFSGVEPRDII